MIAVSPDLLNDKVYSKFPYYVLRKNYLDVINAFGGNSVIATSENIDYAKGLVITGGDFDIHPSYYQEEVKYPSIFNEDRTKFEFIILEKALKKGIPILGICNGMQLLNVFMGGSLIQHIDGHSQPEPKNIPYHEIEIIKESFLGKICDKSIYKVTSTHHQVVDKTKLEVCALSSDGYIEAIALQDYSFCLGVQWHPEYLASEIDKSILKSFINATNS